VLALVLALGAGLVVVNDLILPAVAGQALCRASPLPGRTPDGDVQMTAADALAKLIELAGRVPPVMPLKADLLRIAEAAARAQVPPMVIGGDDEDRARFMAEQAAEAEVEAALSEELQVVLGVAIIRIGERGPDLGAWLEIAQRLRALTLGWDGRDAA
jgi:hypothetical protein